MRRNKYDIQNDDDDSSSSDSDDGLNSTIMSGIVLGGMEPSSD